MAEKGRKSDETIRRDVLRELEWDSEVNVADVGILVQHGVVSLTGTVPSAAERHAALAAAFRVAGVRDVANEIVVSLPGRHVHTDTDIAEAVRHALTWDVYLDEERIRSTVEGGWVTLEGEVASWPEAEYAAAAVRRLTGVRGVVTHLTVGETVMPSTEIKHSIEEALKRRMALELERITVEVYDGVVILRGSVQSWAEKQDAIAAAGQAPGIHAVQDELRIEPRW